MISVFKGSSVPWPQTCLCTTVQWPHLIVAIPSLSIVLYVFLPITSHNLYAIRKGLKYLILEWRLILYLFLCLDSSICKYEYSVATINLNLLNTCMSNYKANCLLIICNWNSLVYHSTFPFHYGMQGRSWMTFWNSKSNIIHCRDKWSQILHCCNKTLRD